MTVKNPAGGTYISYLDCPECKTHLAVAEISGSSGVSNEIVPPLTTRVICPKCETALVVSTDSVMDNVWYYMGREEDEL